MNKELIERLRWLASMSAYNDYKEAADRIEELEHDLLNLVCRIHRDGGHYIAAHGEAKAIADADLVAAKNNADLDALQADNARLLEALKLIKYETDIRGNLLNKFIKQEAIEALAKVRKP